MVKRLQVILVFVLAALLASPVAGGFAGGVVSHGAVASDHAHKHGHDHDIDVLSDVEMPNDAGPIDGHGQSHDASDHVPGNLLPDHEHNTLFFSPVKSGWKLKASKSLSEEFKLDCIIF